MTGNTVAENPDLFQVMPPLSADEYQELKNDIESRGVMIPVEYDEAGNILDGHHRVKACKELGIKEWPSVVRLGMDEAAKRTHARKLNMARRHLNQEQRRGLIQAELKDRPEVSDRQIAKALGIDHKTVSAQREKLETTGEIPQLKTNVGADGKERPRQIDRQRLIVAAARRRADYERWSEAYQRILHTRTRSDEERIAKHQALALMESARPGWRD